MMTENQKLAHELFKIAKQLVADGYTYIYDPDHKKHPGGGYVKTESGWSKGKTEKEISQSRDEQEYAKLDTVDKQMFQEVVHNKTDEEYEIEITDDKVGKAAISYCRDDSVLSKCDKRFKHIADKINSGEQTKFSDSELENFFMPVADKVKSSYATLSKKDGGKETAAYLLGLKSLNPDVNKYINPKAIKKIVDSSFQ